MARNLQLALSLVARDTASKVIKKAMQDTIAQTKAVEKADDQLAKSQKQNSDSAIRASKTLQQESQRAASARSTLGIRSERDIQREIQLTQAAYNRLTRSGVMSANEQSRAFEAMSSRVSRLRGELNSAGQSVSRLERAKGWGSNAMAIAGGVTAAGMVIKEPVQRQMAWTQANAKMVNTGYNELTPEQRIAKMPEINKAIQKSVREGGGTPEQAQETLDSIFSAGQVDNETAMKMLPSIMKYATASGANPIDLAKMASSGIANFGIQLDDLPAFFDKSIRSGENGSFELPDMATFMPKILASGKKVGMSGMGDYEKLLALLQASKLGTGDSSQAATNVDNLLNKYTSADTQNALKKYRFKSRNGKPLSYPDYLADQRLQGVSTQDAFIKGVDGIVSSDSRVKSLRLQAKKYQGTDKENDIKAALDITVASITSKIVADAQAGAALATSIQQRDFIKKQQDGTANATGAGDASFKVMSSTPGFKSEQLESEKFFASLNAMEPLANIYGDLATKLTDYAKEFPEFTAALSGATTGIKALTAAAAAFAGLKFLTGGGIPGIGKKGGGTFDPGDILSGGKAGAVPVFVTNWQDNNDEGGIKSLKNVLDSLHDLPGVLGKIAAVLTAAITLYETATPAIDNLKKQAEEQGVSVGALIVKRANVPKLPSFDFDPSSWWSKPSTIGGDDAGGSVPAYMKPQPQQYPFIPIQIKNTMTLDGKVIAESTNEINASQANRGSTGGQ